MKEYVSSSMDCNSQFSTNRYKDTHTPVIHNHTYNLHILHISVPTVFVLLCWKMALAVKVNLSQYSSHIQYLWTQPESLLFNHNQKSFSVLEMFSLKCEIPLHFNISCCFVFYTFLFIDHWS